MGYKINISKNGNHYFATSEGSIGYNMKLLDELYDKFKGMFPETDGYKISIFNREVISSEYDIEEERLTRERKKQM